MKIEEEGFPLKGYFVEELLALGGLGIQYYIKMEQAYKKLMVRNKL